jgi:hypothetical protein
MTPARNAPRHRQAAHLGHHRRAEDDEQRRRRHDLAGLRGGENPEERVEEKAAGEVDAADGGDGDADVEEPRTGFFGRRDRRKEGDDSQKRHDREVLEEEDRDDLLPRGVAGLAALLEHLEHHRRRGQDETRAGDEGDGRREAGEDADGGEEAGADQNLGDAEAEDLAAQVPQARRLHLEADDEEQHHDAELGDLEDRGRIGEEADAERPDDQARRGSPAPSRGRGA